MCWLLSLGSFKGPSGLSEWDQLEGTTTGTNGLKGFLSFRVLVCSGYKYQDIYLSLSVLSGQEFID